MNAAAFKGRPAAAAAQKLPFVPQGNLPFVPMSESSAVSGLSHSPLAMSAINKSAPKRPRCARRVGGAQPFTKQVLGKNGAAESA